MAFEMLTLSSNDHAAAVQGLSSKKRKAGIQGRLNPGPSAWSTSDERARNYRGRGRRSLLSADGSPMIVGALHAAHLGVVVRETA